MKKMIRYLMFFGAFAALTSCGDSEKQDDDKVKLEDYSKEESAEQKTESGTVDMNDLTNKGIGPVKSLSLDDQIDEALAAKGEALFKNNCTACHKIDKKYIGPAVEGVTERRSPEWIMNMIINPEEMIAKDPIAKQLMIESNMAVMANQNITEEEARAILEYFRKIDE